MKIIRKKGLEKVKITHNKTLFWIIIGLIILLITVLYLISKNPPVPNSNIKCNLNSECVAAACCHPNSCVPIDEKPDCSAVSCTAECAGNTLDCNQGECKCLNNKCEAVINNPLQ